MIFSMTAFSRQQLDQEWGSLTWEIRSVNHRYLEPSLRMPEAFRGLEPVIREVLRNKLSRGKIECSLRFQSNQQQQSSIHINNDLVAQLTATGQQIRKTAPDATALSVLEILRWPGVMEEPDAHLEELQPIALTLFNQALDDLMESRGREGAELGKMIEARLLSIREIVVSVREQMPKILAQQKQNLQDRLADLKQELDSTRLEQEIALLAQKSDVDEELDRLDSHLGEVQRVLTLGEQKGRRLDFLMQELNREANTLSSKSVVAETTRNAVELKVLIEQMREQIQNIE